MVAKLPGHHRALHAEGVTMKRRTPLRRSTRLRSVSRKRQSADALRAWRKIYAEVDARSGGRCEFPPCDRPAVDHHHLVKPRASHHTPDLVVHLCRQHHEQAEQPYQHGRLVIHLDHGRRVWEIVVAESKFSARGEHRA